MVATGNVGLAFGLVVAAGAATTLGACVIFCVKLANAKFLAGALGFSAGVMLCTLRRLTEWRWSSRAVSWVFNRNCC